MITIAKLLELIEESIPDNNSMQLSANIDTEQNSHMGNYTECILKIRYLAKGQFPQIINTEG